MQSLGNQYSIKTQSLDNQYSITMQSLDNQYSITTQPTAFDYSLRYNTLQYHGAISSVLILILIGYIATVIDRTTSGIYTNGKKWGEHIYYLDYSFHWQHLRSLQKLQNCLQLLRPYNSLHLAASLWLFTEAVPS